MFFIQETILEWYDLKSIVLIFFTVRPVVHLSVLEQSNIVSYGQSITLQADITSCLAPSNIQWTRSRDKNEKKEIKEKSGKFVIDNLETSCSKLTIEKFDFSDNGNYSITVSNSVGTVSKDLQLKVEGKQNYNNELTLFITFSNLAFKM